MGGRKAHVRVSRVLTDGGPTVVMFDARATRICFAARSRECRRRQPATDTACTTRSVLSLRTGPGSFVARAHVSPVVWGGWQVGGWPLVAAAAWQVTCTRTTRNTDQTGANPTSGQ